MVFGFPVVLFCFVVVLLCCCVVLLACCFVDISMGGPMEIPMPGGRSEVFRDSGGEAGCLSEERTFPRPVGGIGQGRAARAAKEREGGASGTESRCRNGAVADGIRVRTSSFTRSPARDGFLTPIRSPAAPETSTSLGVSRKIGGKTACGSMRPGPTARRYLCGRSGCHPPVRGAPGAPRHTEIAPPASCQDADTPTCPSGSRTVV